MTRVLALVASEEDASARYRVAQFAPALRDRGIDLSVRPIPAGARARRAEFRSAAEFDAVLWQRRLLAPWDARRLRLRARRLVFDFDDALPFRDSFRGASPSLSRRIKFRAAIGRADVVVAANAYLASLASSLAKRVEILPTVVDPGIAVTRAPSNDGAFVAGWIGSAATVRYLGASLEPLREVARTLGDRFRLHVVADRLPDRAESFPFVEWRPWRRESEAREVARFDVGLAPLPDDPWTRGKAGLKLLQYGAAAVPSVASDVGVQREIVRDGVTGFLARSDEEWVDRVLRLAAAPALRASFGAAARAAVTEKWSIGSVVGRLASILSPASR